MVNLCINGELDILILLVLQVGGALLLPAAASVYSSPLLWDRIYYCTGNAAFAVALAEPPRERTPEPTAALALNESQVQEHEQPQLHVESSLLSITF